MRFPLNPERSISRDGRPPPIFFFFSDRARKVQAGLAAAGDGPAHIRRPHLAAAVRCTRRTRTLSVVGSPKGAGDGGGIRRPHQQVCTSVRHFNLSFFFFLWKREKSRRRWQQQRRRRQRRQQQQSFFQLSGRLSPGAGWLQGQPRVVVLVCIHWLASAAFFCSL